MDGLPVDDFATSDSEHRLRFALQDVQEVFRSYRFIRIILYRAFVNIWTAGSVDNVSLYRIS